MDDIWTAFRNAMLEGRYFEAHEILEEPWRVSRDARLQTAIWVAAAFVHWQRGNMAGALRLFARVRRAVDDALAPDLDTWMSAVEQQHPLMPPTPALLARLENWARAPGLAR